MKNFEAPQIAVVHLFNEDIIRTSTCNTDVCINFVCPEDCLECGDDCNPYNCAVYL